MTGYTVHTGSSLKFSSSWDRIFKETRSSKSRDGQKQSKSASKAKGGKKPAKKKSHG
jgi:hypothetical protein